MKKNNFLKLTFIAALLYAGIDMQAQVKVGDSPTTINAASMLEVESTNKGFLLPRIALSSTTTATLAGGAHVAGMTVYNTATAGDVTPGYYYNDGTKWVRIINATDALAVEPWYNVATNAGATANTQDIYQMGNVGIGTTTPHNGLEVYSSTVNPVILSRTSGTANATFSLQNEALNKTWVIDQDNTNNNLRFARYMGVTGSGFSGAINAMVITDTGNVGIGTTTPTNRLHVTDTTNPLRLEGLQAGAGTDEILTTDATGVVRKQTAVSFAAATEPWYNVATSFGATSNAQSLYHMGSQVSIGTAANYSNARFQVIPETGTGTIAFFGYGPGTNRPYFMFKNDEAQSLSTIDGNSTTNTGKLAFATIGTERMRITETGNVGIGTTAPNNDALLDVSSTTKGVKLPSVALTSLFSASPLSAHVPGMMVYNTTNNYPLRPGVYVNNGTKWTAIDNSGENVFTDNTIFLTQDAPIPSGGGAVRWSMVSHVIYGDVSNGGGNVYNSNGTITLKRGTYVFEMHIETSLYTSFSQGYMPVLEVTSGNAIMYTHQMPSNFLESADRAEGNTWRPIFFFVPETVTLELKSGYFWATGSANGTARITRLSN